MNVLWAKGGFRPEGYTTITNFGEFVHLLYHGQNGSERKASEKKYWRNNEFIVAPVLAAGLWGQV